MVLYKVNIGIPILIHQQMEYFYTPFTKLNKKGFGRRLEMIFTHNVYL